MDRQQRTDAARWAVTRMAEGATVLADPAMHDDLVADIADLVEQLDVARASGTSASVPATVLGLRERWAQRGVDADAIDGTLGHLGAYLAQHLSGDAALATRALLRTAPASPAQAALALAPSAVAVAPVVPLVEHFIAGDRHAAWRSVDTALASGSTYVDVGVDLVQPAMVEVGRRWATREVTVAQEHLASAHASYVMTRAFAASPARPPTERRALFACVEGDHHALGVRMLADAFALDGWNAQTLGADVPTTALVDHVATFGPEVLGLSMSSVSRTAVLRDVIDRVRAVCGTRVQRVIVGGFAFSAEGLGAATVGAEAWFDDARQALHALA